MTSRKELIEKIENNWLLASRKLGFEIISPYTFNFKDRQKKVIAFLPAYGSIKGMIIDLTFPPGFDIDSEITDWAKNNGYCYSFINADMYFDYNEELYVETLKDWGKL